MSPNEQFNEKIEQMNCLNWEETPKCKQVLLTDVSVCGKSSETTKTNNSGHRQSMNSVHKMHFNDTICANYWNKIRNQNAYAFGQSAHVLIA